VSARSYVHRALAAMRVELERQEAQAFTRAFAAAPEPRGEVSECTVRGIEMEFVILNVDGDACVADFDNMGRGCPALASEERAVELTASVMKMWTGNGLRAVIYSFIGPQG
jgi:hypothetical protein